MTPPPRAIPTGELPNLDSLRALAVLLVLSDHVLETMGARFGGGLNPQALYLGRLGVLLFFVHTCYVLMVSLNRLPGTGWSLSRAFFIRRAFRIFPLAVLCILIVMLFEVPPLPWLSYEPPTPGQLAANLTLTMNLTGSERLLNPLWSLPLEVQMYLVLPAIFLVTRRVTDLRWAFGIWGISLLAAFFVAPVSGRLSVLTFSPCFMAGVLAYGLRDRIAVRLPAALWLLCLVSLVALYLLLETITPGIHHVWLQSLVCLLVGFAIPCFQQCASAGFNRLTHLIARYSYGIYLFHCVALWVGYFWIAPQSDVLKALLTLATLVVLSVASYHALEAPMMRLGARLARGPLNPPYESGARSPVRDTP